YCNDGRFRDALLFTHRGLSGPAILQISSYWNGGDALSIDLLPGSDAHAWLETERRSTARLDNILARRLPRRFAQQWSGAHHAAVPVSALDEKRRHELASLLHAWPVLPSGTLGYNKAEVTLGGVDTRALSSRTMAARELPRLHFIGEVVDVTGWLGGYNFQWAWSSGYAAGQHA
ncbi:MAG TPA: NAD(P)/FAD-dependent oxidoreductase, partial [Casimicrobiaceae bacterium]|nr:NAD(P)/FAD-dependent oxidoreductase [Casimicrobiaceae bacterium]